jgi:hypothetical protein
MMHGWRNIGEKVRFKTRTIKGGYIMKKEKEIKVGMLVTCANESEVWRVYEIKGNYAVVEQTRKKHEGRFAHRRVALAKIVRVQ